MILTVAILLAGAGTGYAQSQDANSRKMARKQMKAEQDARDRLAFEEARKAIEAKEFVLEADQVSFKSGSTAQVSSNTNFVAVQGDKAVVGYDKGRIELDGSLSAKWRPTERLGLSVVVREAMYGTSWSPVIPAFFADCLLSRRGNVVAKASVSRNYRFPTLNDLYFLPGGNPGLNSEKGVAYEAGLSFAVGKEGAYTLSGSASWYDQHIDEGSPCFCGTIFVTVSSAVA